MKLWKLALVMIVLVGIVSFLPTKPETHEVASLEQNSQFMLNELKIEKSVPQVVGLSRSPVTQRIVTAEEPLKGMRICLDPGHGGQAKLDKLFYCGGTYGAATHQTEGDVNLRVALFLRQYLQAAGAEVIMTRESDVRVTNGGAKHEELTARSDIANAKKADLFISVHHNESTNANTNYTAVFFPRTNNNAAWLAANIANGVSGLLGTANQGAKVGDYTVLNHVQMPGVIVEASFMSNPAEDLRLARDEYAKTEAKGIAVGLLNYAKVALNRSANMANVFASVDQAPAKTNIAVAAAATAPSEGKHFVERQTLFGKRLFEVSDEGQVVDVKPETQAQHDSARDAEQPNDADTPKA